MHQIACTCGAVYEVIVHEGPFRYPPNSRCVVCERVLNYEHAANSIQFRLIRHPDEDRE